MSGVKAVSYLEAHGALGCIAWAVIAPIGAITIRLVPSTKAWIIHGGIMLFALCLITAGFGIGLARVLAYGQTVGTYAHYIIGTLLFSLAWCQPFLGTAHHFIYKATGNRTILSAMHVFFGRIFMLLGIINGGVGLLLAAKNEPSNRAERIAYGTVVGIVWVTYILVSLQLEVKRHGKGEPIPARGSIGGDSEGSVRPLSNGKEER